MNEFINSSLLGNESEFSIRRISRSWCTSARQACLAKDPGRSASVSEEQRLLFASEVVASKVGKFLEFLTPDSIDHATVEDQVIKKMIENLAAEGIKGEIAAINGLELDGEDLSVHKGLNVRKHAAF